MPRNKFKLDVLSMFLMRFGSSEMPIKNSRFAQAVELTVNAANLLHNLCPETGLELCGKHFLSQRIFLLKSSFQGNGNRWIIHGVTFSLADPVRGFLISKSKRMNIARCL